MVRPSPTLAYFTLWRPNGRGLQSTPLKRSKNPLEYHGVLLCFTISRLRGISITRSISPLHFDVHKEARSKGGMSNTHETQNHSKYAHTKDPDLSSKEYHEVLTRTELKSLRMSNKCVRMKCE
jgi:hypothetical protein